MQQTDCLATRVRHTFSLLYVDHVKLDSRWNFSIHTAASDTDVANIKRMLAINPGHQPLG